MHFYFAYGILIVFFLSHAQESDLRQTICQDYYELVRYPADPETKILFEQAKYKLAKNPHDEDGKSSMMLLAERSWPYMPALIYNTRKAIEQKNLNEALRLSYKGAQFFDPQSIYTQATLLLNSSQVPHIAGCDPRELEFHARDLLRLIAYPTMYLPSAQKDLNFKHDGYLSMPNER